MIHQQEKYKRRLEGQLEIHQEIKEFDFSGAWFVEKVGLSDLSCSERGSSAEGLHSKADDT